MDWKHQTSLEWMKARQPYLNASEIKDLVPVTATGRSRKITDKDYERIYLAKQRVLTNEDTYSTGAMARGHILEPYAIAEFNQHREAIQVNIKDFIPKMYHWDDVVVFDSDLMTAFSPDGYNIEQIPGVKIESESLPPDASAIIEVKSYNPSRHLEAINVDKNKMEERWQIATAMVIDRGIDHAFLVHYNPSLTQGLIINEYKRSDLADEIELVYDVCLNWKKVYDYMNDAHKELNVLSYWSSTNGATVIPMQPHECEIKKRVDEELLARSMSL